MDRVIVVTDDHFGGDDRELGSKLVGLFFMKLRMEDNPPDAIVFYNSAVKLLVRGSAVQHSMEDLLDAGVDILACGTCVKHYGLDENALVGHVSNMQDVVRILMKANSVISV